MTEEHSDHVSSYRSLLGVLVILLVLTGVTVLASRLELGDLHFLHVWISLLIASVKGIFVLWYFMHMKFEPRLIRIPFVATIIVLTLLIGLTFTDYLFR